MKNLETVWFPYVFQAYGHVYNCRHSKNTWK